MNIGDLINVHFVDASQDLIETKTKDLIFTGLLLSIDDGTGLDSGTKMITCLNNKGKIEVIEIGHRRGSFYFIAEVLSKKV